MPESLALDLAELTRSRRVIVCCGGGGVGKTTTAAALGYLAAKSGRNVLVMTIDPARRLAQALGLESLGHAPQRIHIESIAGELHAMMLDTKRTFDSLIEQYAPSDAARETIFANRYYQHLSNSLAGSREFMAMEKVYEMAAGGDIRPADRRYAACAARARLSRGAGAPVRSVRRFVRQSAAAAVPRRGTNRVRSVPPHRSDRLLKVFERLTGYDVLADLSDFFLAFAGMSAGFKERSRNAY